MRPIVIGEPRLQVYPMRRPFYDTEWLDGTGRATFFRDPHQFASAQRGAKTRAHCNMYGPAWMCARGMRFHAYRMVGFVSTEGVREPLAEYRQRVEEYRQSAVCRLVFGDAQKAEWPLADVLANIAPPDFVADPLKAPEEFDPTEAPDIAYRRGADLTVMNQPYVIMDSEDCTVRIEGPMASGICLRFYLAGILLKAIQT